MEGKIKNKIGNVIIFLFYILSLLCVFFDRNLFLGKMYDEYRFIYILMAILSFEELKKIEKEKYKIIVSRFVSMFGVIFISIAILKLYFYNVITGDPFELILFGAILIIRNSGYFT